MTPKQLRTAIDRLTDGNQSELARLLGITDRAVRRRLAGGAAPEPEAKLIRLMLAGRLTVDEVRRA
jgi:DNA-binding transcriptional regulator Cro